MPWQHTHLPYNNIIFDIHPCVIIGARREIPPRAPMSFLVISSQLNFWGISHTSAIQFMQSIMYNKSWDGCC